MTGMDWDQQFIQEETGANLNSTFLKYPCKKCDKKYVTDGQLEEHITNVHKLSPTNLAWTKNPKLWVGWSLMVANDVSIPRVCFAKISEFLKRNWLRAAHI